MNRKLKFNENANGGGGDSAKGATSGKQISVHNNGRKTRILIVEDEPAMVQGLRDEYETDIDIVRRIPLGEFNIILVSALIGMSILASSGDLITLFLGLELMTMPSYLLTGLHKTDRYSNEGGLKYFLLGSFASAFFLFGIAMVYSAGQTDTPTAVAGLYKSQILWLLIGVGFAYAGGHSSVRFIEWMTTPLFLLSLFLLALTLVIGKGAGTAASTKSWLAIGGHRIG